MPNSISVELLQHSACKVTGKQIYTFVAEYPRAIHSQTLTHRLFSRNSSSTRAVPLEAAITEIEKNPADFIWTKKNRGMQGPLVDNQLILDTVDTMVAEHMLDTFELVRQMDTIGIHKQNAGRFLEPFQNIRVIITTTEMVNWDWLRNDEEAQPEIAELAAKMDAAIRESKPMILHPGEYHVPWITRTRNEIGTIEYTHSDYPGVLLTPNEAINLSMSLNAQVSYRVGDSSEEKTQTVQDRLFTGRKVHASPSEHIATPIGVLLDATTSILEAFRSLPVGVTAIDRYCRPWSGNFCMWLQQRQLTPNNVKS